MHDVNESEINYSTEVGWHCCPFGRFCPKLSRMSGCCPPLSVFVAEKSLPSWQQPGHPRTIFRIC